MLNLAIQLTNIAMIAACVFALVQWTRGGRTR
jgi:hypothetical protein